MFEELRNFRLDIHGGPVAIAVILIILYAVLSAITGFGSVIGRFFEMLTGFTKDFNMAFAVIPIYLGWFISDYYQERKGTSFGNAIANDFMGLWVGIDWIRNSYNIYIEAQTPSLGFMIVKLLIAVGMLGYAFVVMRAAARGQKIVHYIGRIREIAYFAIVFTPIVYEVVPLDGLTLAAAVLFFPIVYGLAEFVDYYFLPPSGAELAEESEAAQSEGEQGVLP